MHSDPTVAYPLDSQFSHARDDLERRLRAGDDCRAEDYLAAFPDLAADEERALALIQTEWRVRRDLGRPGELGQWQARFPQWHDRIARLLGGDRQATVPGLGGPADGERPLSLDHHQVLEQIGAGGMGVVYRAWDPVLRREVALKMIKAGVLAGPSEVARFYREARAAAGLHHPHIIPVYGLGTYRVQHCFTMALVTGGSLASHRDRFGGDPRAAAGLVEKVARAVQHAHEHGVIHRDLKPANIFLNEQGEPLVGDFGLARASHIDIELTQPGALMGTPAYMSPEQLSGEQARGTPQTDVWALGVILYELLTGERPFPGRTWDELTHQVRHTSPAAPRSLCPELDRGLEAVVMRCLARDVRDRYPTAAALADDLARWLRGERPAADVSRGTRLWRRLVRPLRTLRVALVALAAVLVVVPFLRLPKSPEGPAPPAEPPPESVTLLGPRGPLADFDWAFRPEGAEVGEAPDDGAATLRSPRAAVLLFPHAPPWPRYRVEAEVRYEGAERGEAGICVAHRRYETARGGEHALVKLTFWEAPGRGGRAQLFLARFQEARPASVGGAYLLTQSIDRQGEAAGNPWRRLTLEVTPEELGTSWDGGELRRITGADLRERARSVLKGIDDDGWWPAAGPPGLFVDGAGGSFRKVIVTRLP